MRVCVCMLCMLCMCVCGVHVLCCVFHRAPVEVRRQAVPFSFLFHHVGTGDQTQVNRLDSKHLCSMDHFIAQWLHFHNTKSVN